MSAAPEALVNARLGGPVLMGGSVLSLWAQGRQASVGGNPPRGAGEQEIGKGCQAVEEGGKRFQRRRARFSW
jgi:hypothetical protein